LALLSLYTNMSASEKAALGYGDDFKDRIIQNYQAMSSFQNNTAGTTSILGLSSYL
jgi:hypothetical protein